MDTLKPKLFWCKDADEKFHSFIKLPKLENMPIEEAFNLVMVDASISMRRFVPAVVTSWNTHVYPNLIGETTMCVFSDTVQVLRKQPYMNVQDFDFSGTYLLKVLTAIKNELESTKSRNVRLFIVTDDKAGDFGEEIDMQELGNVLRSTKIPDDMEIQIFYIGVGKRCEKKMYRLFQSIWKTVCMFTSEYFWAPDVDDINNEFFNMIELIKKRTPVIKASQSGLHVPFSEQMQIHPEDWLYYSCYPQQLKNIEFSVMNKNICLGEIKSCGLHKNICLGEIESCGSIPIEDLMKVLTQWSLLSVVQMDFDQPVLVEMFSLMKKLFNAVYYKAYSDYANKDTIKYKLYMQKLRKYRKQFKYMLRETRIMNLKVRYESDFDNSKITLYSTIETKNEVNVISLKGNTSKNFVKDLEEFREIYEKNKEVFMYIDCAMQDYVCSITLNSTLNDLKDPDFDLLNSKNKFDFLKSFTMSGIPVLTKILDCTAVNCWTICIERILKQPYAVLSQRVLEERGAIRAKYTEDKSILLQLNDKQTRFNAVVPIFSASVAPFMKPFVCTNIYAMCATFSILKNPYIIDSQCHLAALACIWLKTICAYPIGKRPQFVLERLSSIEQTALLYSDRPDVLDYVDSLMTCPEVALLPHTTSGKPTVQSESITKPLFYIYLFRQRFSKDLLLDKVIPLIVREFIARCVCKQRKSDCRLMFNGDLSEKNVQVWLENAQNKFLNLNNLSPLNIFDKYYTIGELKVDLSVKLKLWFSHLKHENIPSIRYKINVDGFNNLKNVHSCGDMNWRTLENWFHEIGSAISTKTVISEDNLLINVCHGLQYKSPDASSFSSREDCQQFIKSHIEPKNFKEVKLQLQKFILDKIIVLWTCQFYCIHKDVVIPLSKDEIIKESTYCVTKENFSQSYTYSENVGIVRNACQIRACPYYLIPDRRFNKHLHTERQFPNYPHKLHCLLSKSVEGDCSDKLIMQLSQEKSSTNNMFSFTDDSIQCLINKLRVEYRRYNSAETSS